MAKKYLIQELQNDIEFLDSLEAGDIIEFEMPGFCSGDYRAIVFRDEYGLYINSTDDYFVGCRDYFKATSTKNVAEEKTSAEWQALFPNIIVIDPDGWDRRNFYYSWNVERISMQEYNKRISYSTCFQRNQPIDCNI